MEPIYRLIKPAKALDDYIYFYTYFKLFVPEEERIYIMPSTDIKLSFNFADCGLINDIRKKDKPAKAHINAVVGLQKQRNYDLILKKNTLYNSLIVFFKPHGFHELFNVSSADITDNYLSTEQLIGEELEEITEKLTKNSLLDERTILLDNYFKRKLEKKAAIKSAISTASQVILNSTGVTNLRKLACDCNLSPRHFERRFKEMIGISAMKLQSINRFEGCLKLKERSPEKKWTEIAFEAGYADQMHLVREFKNLALLTPSAIHWKSGIDGKHWHFLRGLVNV